LHKYLLTEFKKLLLSKYKPIIDSASRTNNCFKVGDLIVKDINVWFSENVNVLLRYPYLGPIKFSDLLKGRFGDCEEANAVRVTALRSLGIPSVIDEVPNWGNHNEPHYNYKIIDPVHDTVKSLITNRNIKRDTQHIFSASSYDEPDYRGVPKYASVTYVRSIPKVYRRFFSKQATRLAMTKLPNDEIPKYFRNLRLSDVTMEYVDAADITVRLRSASGQKYCYLCVLKGFYHFQWP